MFNELYVLKPLILAVACFGLAYWLFTLPDQRVLAWVTAGLGAAYLLVGVTRLLPSKRGRGDDL